MTATHNGKTQNGLGTLVRNEYWHGKLMGAADFQREQDYVRGLQRTMARLTIGCGVLCGLAVGRVGDKGISVSAGAGLDGSGQLIIVPSDHEFEDVSTWICGNDPSNPGTYEFCLMHHDCPTLPAPSLVTDCDTHVECKPGAMEERYRFEARPVDVPSGCGDTCSSCGRVIESGRACPCDCTDCVPLAQFEWTGTTISSVSMSHRTEVPSNRQLHEMLTCTVGDCEPTAVVAPRLLAVWPRPGSILDRKGSPSDRPIEVDRIDDPDDWIRAWVIVGDGDDRRCQRTRLRYLDRVDGKACGEHTVVLEIDARSNDLRRGDTPGAPALAIVVQAISEEDTGPLGAAPVGLPAQIQHAGTGMSVEELDRLWDRDECPDIPIQELGSGEDPGCFGDGYDGGRLHAVFYVSPVEEETHVTAVYPYNGERVGTEDLPPLEISMASSVPDGIQPRAWLIANGTHRALDLTRVEDPDEPMAARRFESSFDDTLASELARTARWDVTADDAEPGRVLVVVPSEYEEGFVGGFAGTCLSDAEVARAYTDDLKPGIYDRIRPTDLRMPRAGEAGHWIHFTYAWEGSRS
jgi:hypothetical protein